MILLEFKPANLDPECRQFRTTAFPTVDEPRSRVVRAAAAFFDGEFEPWMAGHWWATLSDDGNLDIGQRAEPEGEIFPHGVWVYKIQLARHGRPEARLRDFYEALGTDWGKVRSNPRVVFGGHLPLVATADGTPTLHAVPQPFLDVMKPTTRRTE